MREFVGVQLQESALPPRLRVGEAVRLFASFYPNSQDPNELLESLGIKEVEYSPFKKLSGGQKQRLSIALALVGNPRLAILDELTTGLDPEARRETWNIIERMRERGVTVILVTHFMDEAERLCDRLALINHGAVRALDTPEAIAAQAGGAGSDSSLLDRLTSRPCEQFPVSTKSREKRGTSPSLARVISRERSSMRWRRSGFEYQTWRQDLETSRMPSSS